MSENPQNHEHEGFGLLNNEIGILLYQIEAEKTITLLKVLFKYIFTMNGPKMAIIITINFPIIFL